MTHYNAETLEEVTEDELSKRYDSYLDESGEYVISVDGNDLIPSEVLKSADPLAYEQSLYAYINALYDAGELMSEWDREEHIKDKLDDWAFDVLGVAMDYTTIEEDNIIKAELFKLYSSGVLVLDDSEIELSDEHHMSEVLIAIGSALKENKK